MKTLVENNLDPADRSDPYNSAAIAPEGAKGVDIGDYGAIPNDGIDDTAAIQRALDDERRDANGKTIHSDFNGRPKHLYLPEGIYNVSDTIDWVGNAVTLNGDGSGKTILKLDDNASGFGSTESSKAVIESSDGNKAFRNNIWNLSVDTGKGNVGAIGIDYGASNNGSMENVAVTSGDGQGAIGVSMADGIPGPLLLKNVKVDGFDTGIKNSGPYSATFKDIELVNQNKAGIDAGGGTLVIDGLESNNSVPAVKSDYWFEMVTIINSDLQGGAPGVSAIESRGQLYARDINTSGYQSAVKYKDEFIAGDTVEEYASQTSELFDNSAQKSLNLPIKDFPEFNDSNLDNWGEFEPRWYGDTSGLQDLLNSGKSTIYFPAGRYFSYNQRVVTVPSTVKKIVGFSSIVNGSREGKNGGGIKFVVEEDSKDSLIVEGFGHGITVENNAARDVALKNGKYKYADGPGISDLYIENIVISRLDLKNTANVYAWQLNTESLDETRTKITNSGANMVVVGIKTEGKGPVIDTINGGKTEVLGGVILPIQPFSEAEKKQAAFSVVDSEGLDSEGSFNIRFRHYENSDRMYDILVEETQDGETRQLESSKSPHEFLTLYSGNQSVGAQTKKKPDTPIPVAPPKPEPTITEPTTPEPELPTPELAPEPTAKVPEPAPEPMEEVPAPDPIAEMPDPVTPDVDPVTPKPEQTPDDNPASPVVDSPAEPEPAVPTVPKPIAPDDTGALDVFRVESEDLRLKGYRIEKTRGSGASGGQQISLKGASKGKGTASGTFEGPSGDYQVKVGLFDENDGQSKAELTVGDQTVSFVLDEDLPGNWTTGTKTSRTVMPSVELETGDSFSIKAAANKGEFARFDYVEFSPVASPQADSPADKPAPLTKGLKPQVPSDLPMLPATADKFDTPPLPTPSLPTKTQSIPSGTVPSSDTKNSQKKNSPKGAVHTFKGDFGDVIVSDFSADDKLILGGGDFDGSYAIQDIAQLVFAVEHDGDGDTDALRDGKDIVFALGQGNSIRLESLVGRNGLTVAALDRQGIDIFPTEVSMVAEAV